MRVMRDSILAGLVCLCAISGVTGAIAQEPVIPDDYSVALQPWTGDYEDGLGNKISIVAYANPEDVDDEKQRGDGYGIARFDFANDALTFECWPRFPVVGADGAAGALVGGGS